MTAEPTTLDPIPGSDPSDAIQYLMQAHGGMLFGLGRRFCGNEDEAADLVQETMLEAFRSWPTFRGDAKVTTWLYRIAARTCQRMHRKKGPASAELPSNDILLDQCGLVWLSRGDEATPLDQAMKAEAKLRLESAIADLPVEYRMPLVLKEVVGFSGPDIADITGMNEATVRVRVHRARLTLRRAIERGLPEPSEPGKYDEQVCRDLLDAKQEAMDRGVEFEIPIGGLTDRCKAVFESLDLTQDMCHALGADELPTSVVDRITTAMGSGSVDR
ncbi:MAG: sigma-70 family RNA polymerase sigma factor [Planctomycetes bacterium]|jgi:RNA polymerase sigma-70 factor (ECF subfamily)|nr:sigma-70 family RNA polymerase sigma factor [Planctomycetota bacterium]MCP4839399.1 sigma-70 family RNA polymerase sigma factor [Planctomycetota bacterium]